MKDQFDAYRMWLGIPSEEQPPHHYRLLGIGLFETNREVIERAADRQSEHLKTHQTGPRAALSQKLLTEVAAAAACLRDAEKKAAYDDTLRQQLASRTSAKSTSEPEFPALQIAASSPLPRAKALAAAKPVGLIARGKPSKKTTQPVIEIVKVVVGALAGLFLAVLVLSYFFGKDLLGWSKGARDGQGEQIARRDVPSSSPPSKRDTAPAGRASKESVPSSQSRHANAVLVGEGDRQAAADAPLPSATESKHPDAPGPGGIVEQQAPQGSGHLPLPVQTAEDAQFQPAPPAAAATPSADTPPGASNPPDASAGTGAAIPASTNIVRLVDLEPLYASVSWGKFQKNTPNIPGSEPMVGPQLRFAEEFIYAHATSKLVYKVPRGQKSFTVVGYCPSSRSVRFTISNQNERIAEGERGAFHAFKVNLPERTTELHLEIDTLGNGGRDQSFWCYPRLHQQPADEIESFASQKRSVLLTEQTPISASVGYGKLLINQAPDTWLRPLHPDSLTPCEEYLYAHADSRIDFAIPPSAKRFSAIGYAMYSQSVRFRVLVDERLLVESGQAGVESIGVDIPAGAQTLTLVTDCMKSATEDHAFWCYPRFICSADESIAANSSNAPPAGAAGPETDKKPIEAAHEAVANGNDPVATKLQIAKTQFQELLDESGERLVQAFDEQSKKLQANKKLSLEQVFKETDKLQTEKAEFIADNKRLPASKVMQLSVGEYRRTILGGRNRCETAFEKAAEEYRKAKNLSAAREVLEELGRFRQAHAHLIAREPVDPLAVGAKWEGSKIFREGTRREVTLEVTDRRGSELKGRLMIYFNGMKAVNFDATIQSDSIAFRFPADSGQPTSMIGRIAGDTMKIVEDKSTYGQTFELARKVQSK